MPKVLIADDDALMTDVLELFLRDCGYDVSSALSGPEALSLGRKKRPDVLICDYALSDLDGPEVARRLQSECPQLRVFLASGHSDRLVRAAATDLDHVEVLTKPLDLAALEAALAAALGAA